MISKVHKLAKHRNPLQILKARPLRLQSASTECLQQAESLANEVLAEWDNMNPYAMYLLGRSDYT